MGVTEAPITVLPVLGTLNVSEDNIRSALSTLYAGAQDRNGSTGTKQKVGELYGMPIVIGDDNTFRFPEIPLQLLVTFAVWL